LLCRRSVYSVGQDRVKTHLELIPASCCINELLCIINLRVFPEPHLIKTKKLSFKKTHYEALV
jgi:hypothetical protein